METLAISQYSFQQTEPLALLKFINQYRNFVTQRRLYHESVRPVDGLSVPGVVGLSPAAVALSVPGSWLADVYCLPWLQVQNRSV